MFENIKTFDWAKLEGKELIMVSSFTEDGSMLVGIDKEKGLIYVLAYKGENE